MNEGAEASGPLDSCSSVAIAPSCNSAEVAPAALMAPGVSGHAAATTAITSVAGKIPRVRLVLQYPAGRFPSARCAKRFQLRVGHHESRALDSTLLTCKPTTISLEPKLWPSGGSWMPNTSNWGTRNPGYFGCGKCRWRPTGCRGCIAASADYVAPSPLQPELGSVAIPVRGIDEDSDRDPDRRERLARLLQSVRVAREGQSDPCGFGVVATRDLCKGEVLLDPSVVYVARPSDYAVAHLPQYYALELGAAGYFRLREPAFGHCSLTYFVNEARHLGQEGPAPNTKYKVVRPRHGGIALGLEMLTAIEAGSELLCQYNQQVTE